MDSGLRETAVVVIGYHLGLHGGNNGGCYADPAEVPSLIKLYEDELTADEVADYQRRLVELQTGQPRLI